MYTGDNDGYFSRGWSSDPLDDGYKHGHYVWINCLEPYYKNWKLRICPATSLKKLVEIDWAANTVTGTQGPDIVYVEYNRQNGEELDGKFISLTENVWVNNSKDTSVTNAPLYWRNINSGTKGQANNIPILADGQFWLTRAKHTDFAPEWDGQFLWENASKNGEMCRVCNSRHGQFTNGVFMDLSARKLGLKQLWKLKWHRRFDTTMGPVSGLKWPSGWSEWMKDLKDY